MTSEEFAAGIDETLRKDYPMSTYDTLVAAAKATADVCADLAVDAAKVADEARVAANKARSDYFESVAQLVEHSDYYFANHTQHSEHLVVAAVKLRDNTERKWKAAAAETVDATRAAVDAVAAAIGAYDVWAGLDARGGDQ